MLRLRVGLAHEDGSSLEARRFCGALDGVDRMEVEVERRRDTEELVDMRRLDADVEGEEREAAGREDARDFPERPSELRRRDVNDRVERDDAAELTFVVGEGE